MIAYQLKTHRDTHTHTTTQSKSFIAYQISKTDWGNKKNASTKENRKHTLRKRKRRKKEKEEKERINSYKESITKLKETTSPLKQ